MQEAVSKLKKNSSFFLSGMDPVTNSRNCTCQQSSVNRRDQCVCTKVSVQNMLAGSQGFRMHVGNVELQCGWLLAEIL